jgi:16S rRNA (cytidine1402-2'-O)-methyltransferase
MKEKAKDIQKGVLFVVATPIGNLGDITLRSLETLKTVDLILCEDTRTTAKLLARYEIKTPTLSYHQHSKLNRVSQILELLRQGRNLALVCDAGTPGISDPGSKLIAEIIRSKIGAEIVPLPGPSAVIAAASISGISMSRFLFLGFAPAKKKRKKYFQEAVLAKCPVIFYESSHRILKTLKELQAIAPGVKIVLCRELTKKFETIYRGTIEQVLRELEKTAPLGEFVVIVEK